MERQSLYFVEPGKVAVQTEPLPEPNDDEILVQTLLSAISSGTERLIYCGQVSADLVLDESIADLEGNFQFPFKYGYALIGRVIAKGKNVSDSWLSRTIFAFHPHESHFTTKPDHVFPLPAGVSTEDAVFLPNMETAINLVLDGKPLIGERVLVLGQGIVGLLTTMLLAKFPLESLTAVDTVQARLDLSRTFGASDALTPDALTAQQQTQLLPNFDLIFELSGNPAALNQAVAAADFDGRIIVGSWYGTKQATLDLGGRFHRQRLHLISSQVSTLAPELTGRWQKSRRINLAWQMVSQHQPAQLISHRFPLAQAADAYKLLEAPPTSATQIVLTY